MINLMTARIDNPPSLLRPIAICLVAAAIMTFAVSLPPWSFYGNNFGLMLGAHLVLELFSVVVSILLVIIAWKTLDGTQKSTANILVYGFCLVAGLDLVHALSFEGMPVIWSENSTAKAIFFWLSARSVELLTVFLIAARLSFPGRRYIWLSLALFTVALLTYFGNYYLEVLPTLFVQGQGVTAFKAVFEYALCLGNLLLAGWFFWLSRHDSEAQAINLAVACFIIGVGELAFSKYVATSDFINVLGHVYKVVAYIFLFRVAFQTGFNQPYELLLKSEQKIANKQSELEALIAALPVGVAELDRELRYRYANSLYKVLSGTNLTHIKGRLLADVMPAQIQQQLDANMKIALKGQRVEIDYSLNMTNGESVNHSNVFVPYNNASGDIDGILAILIDNTERTRVLKDLMSSQREICELQSAVDQHAIMAITDDQGVITRVNDKFCQISQYAREELLGRTHSLINSGIHPKSFFQELWCTISEGQVWNGDICNRAKDGSIYWVHTTIVPLLDENRKPIQYIAIRADITSRKLAEQNAQHMAFHDGLTGLPNRRLMSDRLGLALLQSKRSSKYGALMLLDIDHFKEINDTLGHSAGDELLRKIALRLKESVNTNDTVARLGGDEFVVILESLGGFLDQATALANDIGERIREASMLPLELEGHSLTITQSIGVVVFNESDDDPSELLKRADIALYKAKGEGRNRLCFFEPALQADMTERLALTRDLRMAIEREELILHYQPVVDRNSSTLGVEALLRWNHPDRGLVPPTKFIPLAEQGKLILSIGSWVLNKACEQLSQWAEDPLRSSWTIAVNVSARQLYESDFVKHVEKILDQTGANPLRLRLELTESMLQTDLGGTIDKMQTLQTLGIRFSLDDFGTGYSSLSYLRKLPLDQLKIDKSFVNEMLTNSSDATVVRAILSLAKNLGLNVVAEGVEVAEQFDFLVQEGCLAFQGYLFSRPLPIEKLFDSLNSNKIS